MIAHCRQQHGESHSLRWAVRSFEEPPESADPFDVVICVGNSLALAPDLQSVSRAIGAMLSALRPGGACVLHVLNLWHLPDGPCVWQKCKRVRREDSEYLLMKGVHRVGARGFVDVIAVDLSREPPAPVFEATPFLGLDHEFLAYAARERRATDVRCYGDYHQGPYQREQSVDLILMARK